MSKAMLYFLCLKSAFKIRNALNTFVCTLTFYFRNSYNIYNIYNIYYKEKKLKIYYRFIIDLVII